MDTQEGACLPKLSRVAVCGGTHGNELSGVYLIKELMKRRREADDEEQPILVLSNPRAAQQCLRYIEVDLNRCFSHDALNAPLSDSAPYEVIRSREINAVLGPKGSADSVDFICDLHNTTANMGLCFISCSDSDWISLHIFKHLQLCIPDIPMRYLHFDLSHDEAYSLDSVGKHGFAMEVGPQPHGVVRSNVYTTMKTALELVLHWIRLFNCGTVFEGGPVDVFTLVKHVDYPRDCSTHDIVAAIHPLLQDKDFCLLNPGDPVFQTFSGETITYNGSESLYPFFINECAYYEKGIAFSLSRKSRVNVPSLRANRDQSR
ncbi:N-acyl-aromatic-L-amino acid amidohydrolase (carboxylate-forming) B-like [Periophthalmus magnuspinnatus]|uniref:N-acyl-aromatic-L-amino acid amidohydrolase (carboxylate-forming) B-like n=1 Tax=Periophthalmus magnuspinnatus TaxID=409849 RepID=UPI00243656A7|nr:N-acyl-aromatic-L-amino acid amidohydrolase (carboxylate-forming) B-like [Periophthalmus magnuspinnatus]